MKRRKFAGQSTIIGSTEELSAHFATTEGKKYYVCMKCTTYPLNAFPEAIQVRIKRTLCEGCNELVYYDAEHLTPHSTIVCTDCVPTKNVEYYANAASIDLVEKEAFRLAFRKIFGS